MNAQISQEELEMKIIEIFKLLEETFKGKDNDKIKESTIKLNQIFSNIKESINILFVALSSKIISGQEIPLELHKSITLYFKNLLYAQKDLEPDDISYCLNKIFELIFNKNKENPNINYNLIFNAFQNMIHHLLSFKNIIAKKDYINQSFKILLNNIQIVNDENFLQIAKSVILLSSNLLSTKSADENNYIQLINDYYIPIINIIFEKVPNYINPEQNIYNIDFIIIIKYMLDGFYSNLSRMKGIIPNDKIKEICMNFFKKYGTYCFELVQLMPQFDEETKNIFGNPNKIIVFNKDEKISNEMNLMKSKSIQFLAFITQISTLQEKYNNDEIKNNITDVDLQKIVMDLIKIITIDFQDILNNKQKYDYIRKYSREIDEEEEGYNTLLYHICVFLTRSLIREPIKTELSSSMRRFLLDILFPLLVTVDDEKNFMETDPDGYHQYINDIIFKFKNKNFRTSGCFLIKKICQDFNDMNNFVLSFCFEMLNYIIKGNQIKNELSEYNIYLKYQNNVVFDKFNDKIKVDFCLLIFLIMKEKIYKDQYLKNKFCDLLIENYEKLNLIPFQIVKIKLCKIYYYFIPMIIEQEQKKEEKEKKRTFIENVVNYLLNCIVQKDLKMGDEYSQALSYDASGAIIELMNTQKNAETKENNNKNYKTYISKHLENNFEILNQLIPNIDNYTFFLLIEQIIETIKINQRNLLFKCMNNLTKKFIEQYSNQNQGNKLFFNQYFTILNSFLTGLNKISSENKEEITKFNELFDPILNNLKNPTKFIYYEQLVSTAENCIKCFDKINERSILVLKLIKIILDKDSCISTTCFNFISTFLIYMKKNKSEQPINETELYTDILEIIKKGFTFNKETFKTSIIHSLLLTLHFINIYTNLNKEIFEYLLLKSLDCFEFANEISFNSTEIVNQLSLAIVSLGFIFQPENTFQILNQKVTVSKNGENFEFSRTEKYLSMILYISKISFPYYYPNLGKCVILGICSIFSNKFCQDNFEQNRDFKFYLLISFIKLIIFHHQQKCLILENLVKKELKCNFLEESEEEDEDDEEQNESEDDEELNTNIEQALNINDNIKNSDEFKFFSNLIKNIKDNDKMAFDFILSKMKNGIAVLEEYSRLRTIKVKYKEKEYTVPRKIVKIIRKTK